MLQDDQDLGDSGAGARQPAAEVGLRGAGRGRRLPHRQDCQCQGGYFRSLTNKIVNEQRANILAIFCKNELFLFTQNFRKLNRFLALFSASKLSVRGTKLRLRETKLFPDVFFGNSNEVRRARMFSTCQPLIRQVKLQWSVRRQKYKTYCQESLLRRLSKYNLVVRLMRPQISWAHPKPSGST